LGTSLGKFLGGNWGEMVPGGVWIKVQEPYLIGDLGGLGLPPKGGRGLIF